MAWGHSPFAPLRLTNEEKTELLRTSNSLVDEFLSAHGDFLRIENAQPDLARWKLLRERDGLRVYRGRHHDDSAQDVSMQHLITVGSLDGSFEDMAYGMLCHDSRAMQTRSIYLDDAFQDGAVLATLLSPTKDLPFRSVTIRWCVKSVPLFVRAVSKHHDFVFLQATGTRILENGEVIGYHLVQAIDHVDAPPLDAYERSEVSVCTLWRQLGPDRVQVVTRTYVMLEDSLLEAAKTRLFADTMLAMGKVIHCAQLKKLSWLVQNRRTVRNGSQDRDDGGRCCVVCGETLAMSRRNSKHACIVCAKSTCRSCRVLLDLALATQGNRVRVRHTRVCVECMAVANLLDASMIAGDEATTALRHRKTLGRSLKTTLG